MVSGKPPIRYGPNRRLEKAWIEISTEEAGKMTDEELKEWLRSKLFPDEKKEA